MCAGVDPIPARQSYLPHPRSPWKGRGSPHQHQLSTRGWAGPGIGICRRSAGAARRRGGHSSSCLPPPFPLPRLPRESGGLRLRLAGSCQVEPRGSSGFGPGWVRRRRRGEGAGARIRGVEFRGVGLAFYPSHPPPAAPPPPGIPPEATPVSSSFPKVPPWVCGGAGGACGVDGAAARERRPSTRERW